MELRTENSLTGVISRLFGDNKYIVNKRPVSGGDINRAYRLTLSDGAVVFMKCNSPKRLSFFTAEVNGLEALRKSGTIGVPKPLAVGTDEGQGIAFLLMEFLDSAPRIDGYWETFGRELAVFHCADCRGFVSSSEGLFGFVSDNFIGATPQKNTPTESWVNFFRDCRLLPQIRLAEDAFDLKTRRQLDSLLGHLDRYLSEPERPSLLHGDLWSGNVVCGPDGKAWVLDPAVYVGHCEAELAMTELFGGFPSAFYGAYNEGNLIPKEYRDRRDIYNLYHLLNHLNLFGGGYLGPVQSVLKRYALN